MNFNYLQRERKIICVFQPVQVLQEVTYYLININNFNAGFR